MFIVNGGFLSISIFISLLNTTSIPYVSFSFPIYREPISPIESIPVSSENLYLMRISITWCSGSKTIVT